MAQPLVPVRCSHGVIPFCRGEEESPGMSPGCSEISPFLHPWTVTCSPPAWKSGSEATELGQPLSGSRRAVGGLLISSPNSVLLMHDVFLVSDENTSGDSQPI